MIDGSDKNVRRDLHRRLGRAGYILTYPRQVILSVLEQLQGSFSAEEIVRIVAEREPKVGRATVFRTLAILEQLGAVERIPVGAGGIPPGLRYFVCTETEHHHHVVCVSCGRVATSVGCILEERIQETADRAGFSVESHVAFIFGRCRRCRARLTPTPPEGGLSPGDAPATE